MVISWLYSINEGWSFICMCNLDILGTLKFNEHINEHYSSKIFIPCFSSLPDFCEKDRKQQILIALLVIGWFHVKTRKKRSTSKSNILMKKYEKI